MMENTYSDTRINSTGGKRVQDRSDLEEILQVAQRGSDFAEIFMERTESTRIGCEDRQIERVISGREQGAGIRAVRGDNTAYGYTNSLDKESLLALADQVARAARAEATVAGGVAAAGVPGRSAGGPAP